MTQAQEPTGRLLAGRYRLADVLGRGGMGTVWRAEDEMLGRVVAVKELRLPGGVDDEERHRLIVRTLREAKATARIKHAAAVTVFDVVEEDDRPWIVMELVESRSLAEVIKDDGPVPPVRAAEIALDVLGVLAAAHAQGILHRDVKPSNVLIGEDGRVVLTDFGIASVEGDSSITSTGMLVGAPSYISPERAQGRKPGPPADLWSLGGTLYAMVEGTPPYDRGSALATLTAVMTEPLVPPEHAGPLLPIIEGLLRKDPVARLDGPTTRAMLKRIVADGAARAEATTQQAVPAPAIVPPTGAAVEAEKPARPAWMAGAGRRKAVLVGAALAVVLAVAATAAVLLPGSGADQNTGNAPAAQSSAAAPAQPAAPTTAAPASPEALPSAAATTASAAPSGLPATPSASPTSGIPAGYGPYRDGFSITLPGWLKLSSSSPNNRVFKSDSGAKLVIEWTDTPGASALKDWQDQERDNAGTFTNYRRVNLAAVQYRSWANAADWEWISTGSGGTTIHSLDRGFVTGKYGYAIYWIMPDADWNSSTSVQARQVVFDSFQPAP